MDDTTGRMKTPGADETEARTQEIRDEIAQTRVEMSETIEAIQERLTPSHLVAQAGETVRNAATEKVKQMANTAGDAADQVMDSSFVQTIKSNPIPAAMLGIGAAWLLLKGRSDSSRDFRRQDHSRDWTSGGYGSGQRDWGTGATNEVAVGTSGYDAHASAPGSEASRAPDFGGDIRGYDRGYVRDYSQSVSFDRVVRDNPLVVGAAAALVGVAIGMSLPASEAENRLMGDARDTVVDRAKGLASEAADKVQDVAGQAVEAATQVGDVAARAAGATGDSGSMHGSGSIGGSESTGNTGSTRARSTRRTPLS